MSGVSKRGLLLRAELAMGDAEQAQALLIDLYAVLLTNDERILIHHELQAADVLKWLIRGENDV
jgi:ATP/maltotriose-dependent transcriptional regulator MalT